MIIYPPNYRKASFDPPPSEEYSGMDRYLNAIEKGHRRMILNNYKEELQEILRECGFVHLKSLPVMERTVHPGLPHGHTKYQGDQEYVFIENGREERRIVVGDVRTVYYKKTKPELTRYDVINHVNSIFALKREIPRDILNLSLRKLNDKFLANMVIEQERIQDEENLSNRHADREGWLEPVFNLGEFEYMKIERPSSFWKEDEATLREPWSPFCSYINFKGEKVHIYRKKPTRLLSLLDRRRDH